MGVDWLTLLAQIVNILILIWLLRKFLYRPVLKVIDERQALIRAEIDKAQQTTLQAQKELENYKKKLADFDAKRDKMFEEAVNEVEAFKTKMTDETKKSVHLTKQNWQAEVKQEKRIFDEELQNAIILNFKKFANDALCDIADTDLSVRIIEKFMSQMEKQPQKMRSQFAQSALEAGTVWIDVDIKPLKQMQEKLEKFLLSWAGLSQKDVKFEYQVNSKIISGVRIRAGEQMISWNLQSYLEEFENNMDLAFTELLREDERDNG